MKALSIDMLDALQFVAQHEPVSERAIRASTARALERRGLIRISMLIGRSSGVWRATLAGRRVIAEGK